VRRLLTGLLLTVAAMGCATLIAAGGGDGGEARRYTIALDNAFGLVEGGDVRVAGVNAGSVVGLDLDRRTQKALVEVEITERGFGSLRSDAFCESRPQSPIGEYFLDCLPGTSRTELPPGGRLPVRQTASTIPPDLVQNIMRLPYRERFRLIINEFGAGLAGRPEDLNEAIRRGVPALRQSARLLNVLADHNRVIRDLVANADRVIGRLAGNRRDVGRFVVEARDTASASAERREDIATNFRKLPDFLEELTPTMAALGEAAEEQRPVLVDLNASAGELRRFFDESADFYEASRPALRALAEAAGPGRQALRAARPRIRELRSYASRTPDLGRNLRITLEDFDDQDRAVERDPRSPGGRGYSGTQALLSYAFNQSLVNNAFDELGYMVRAAAHTDHCSPYADAETARRPDKADCRSWLGPTQPGVTTPDVSDELAAPAGARRRGAGEAAGPGRARGRAGGGPDGAGGLGGGRGGGPADGLQRLLDGLLGGAPRPDLRRPRPGLPAPPAPAPDPRALDGPSSLLDFLLGP
jgi:ABC-type transporter Mla subunit MlaD